MRHQSIWPAVVLILFGLWFLAGNLGLSLPGLGRLWPFFIIIGGLVTLGSYVSGADRSPGQIFSAVTALGIGIYFLLFSLELTLPILGHFEWSRMAEFWPGFVLIGALALLAQFAATGFRRFELFLAGLLVLVVSIVAFAFTLDFLSQTLAQRLIVFWPVILILVGLWLVTQQFFKRS
jgi:hypothetical protein